MNTEQEKDKETPEIQTIYDGGEPFVVIHKTPLEEPPSTPKDNGDWIVIAVFALLVYWMFFS